jgi:DNA replication protein DnaC
MSATEKQASETIESILARLQQEATILPQAQVEARRAERDQHKAQELIAELMRKWNAPKRQVNAEVVVDGEWGKLLHALYPKLGTGFLIVLHGTHGGGKTQLAVELMRYQVMKRLKSARFTTAMEFFMAVKATYREGSEKDETQLVEEFCKPGLLVVDEVEKRGESSWENNLLFHLFNKRYNDEKDTVLISNLPATDLSLHLGPSLVSRLNETGGMISCNWPSRR